MTRPRPEPSRPLRARPPGVCQTAGIAAIAAIATALFAAFAIVSVSNAAQADEGERVTGRAIDTDTGEGIADAWVFEAIPRRRAASDVRRFSDVRVARTDRDGRFSFPPRDTSFLARLFFWRARVPARYDFYHPNYGLVWGREARGDDIEIRASLRDSHLRLADAKALCTGSPSGRDGSDRVDEGASVDPLREAIRADVCPPRDPSRYEDGSPRAAGPVDSFGRRTGRWTFYRRDGSVSAEGSYQDGGAVGEWVFHPGRASDFRPSPN